MRHFRFYFDDETNTGTDAGADAGTQEQTDNDKKYTDADLDRIINQKFQKWQKQQEKKIDEAKKLAEMTAQERAEHERDELQKELDALKKANSRAEMEKTARGILAEDGITIPDSLLSNLISDDADATSTAVKEFAKAYNKALQDGITAKLAGKTPPAGNTAGTLTKADIMKEKDPIKRQKLIKQNMKLFR